MENLTTTTTQEPPSDPNFFEKQKPALLTGIIAFSFMFIAVLGFKLREIYNRRFRNAADVENEDANPQTTEQQETPAPEQQGAPASKSLVTKYQHPLLQETENYETDRSSPSSFDVEKIPNEEETPSVRAYSPNSLALEENNLPGMINEK